MAKGFVHLHVHTEYSLLDGLSKIKDLVTHVKSQKMDSVAITDHGVMYGAIEFYKASKKEDIKPLIGMEGYVTKGDHTIKERGKGKNYHLLLLAKNKKGYQNLMQLTSIAHVDGYYYRPRFSREVLKKYSEGLIVTSACPQGELTQALFDDDAKEAREIVKWYQEVFGDDYYLELQRHDYAKWASESTIAEVKQELQEMAQNTKKAEKEIIRLSREFGIPLVATNDSHYTKKEDAGAQDALLCIATGKNISDVKRMRFIDTPDFYLKSASQMREIFQDLPEAADNTLEIGKKCNLAITIGTYFFPKIHLPKDQTAEEFLTQRAKEGFGKKFPNATKEYKDRLEYELNIINEKEYAAYFIIFWDMAHWTAKRGIPINIRGSVAGSLTTYVLGITTVDPIAFGLPFERFLNPMRPSAPDIDLDIADDKRDELIGYLVAKYGEEKVAQICTFGRMLARGSVRDVARVLGYEYAVGDRIAKLIPIGSQGFPMTIERALKESPELAEAYKSDEDTKKVINLARQIEGNARHVSVHAAGVVISPTNLTDFTPLQLADTGGVKKVITQYEMWSCDDIGLVKLDILGIRNLSILREAINLANKVTGANVDLFTIPLDDKKTFEMLSRGETMGVFQLSGSGMTRYLVDMRPEKIEDIMMMIALFRPGPMNNIDEYIARKHAKRKITYYHPKMEKFLKASLGVLVYQDDLLYTAVEVAGYDWLEVDKFRKAVGKKIPEEMAKQHVTFVEGCMKHSGMTKKEAEGLWDLFEPFQGYGFNKAHSASYGMVAYWTAYMKANYPVEYMTALLTAESGDKDKITAAVSECRRIGIKVLPPDINASRVDFTVVGAKDSLGGLAIRFGLSAIKNVGKAAIEAILEARKEGEFTSFADFVMRVDNRKVNKKVVESLIKVGALGSFGTRSGLLAALDEVRSKIVKKPGSEGQQGLFAADELTSVKKSAAKVYDDTPEFAEDKLTFFEKELMGYSLSAKPIEEMLAPIIPFGSHKIHEIADDFKRSNRVKLACVISDIRIVVTKKSGKEMAFAKVDDGTGTINVVIFPSIFEDSKNLLADQQPILISGKLDDRDDEISVLADTIETVQADMVGSGDVDITVPRATRVEKLRKLKNLLLTSPGNQAVRLHFEGNGRDEVLLPFKINWNQSLARKISEILV